MKRKQIILIVLLVLIVAGGIVHRVVTQDVDHNGATRLMRAIEHNDRWKKIAKLIDKGDQLNLQDKNGRTALFYAARYLTDKDQINYLLKAGADINIQNKLGQSVLFEAARYNPSADVVTMLCEMDVPVNQRDINGNTPLLLAARYNSSGIVKALINEGADLEMRGDDGRTAREVLAENDHLSEQEKTDFRQTMTVLSMLEARLAARERAQARASAKAAKAAKAKKAAQESKEKQKAAKPAKPAAKKETKPSAPKGEPVSQATPREQTVVPVVFADGQQTVSEIKEDMKADISVVLPAGLMKKTAPEPAPAAPPAQISEGAPDAEIQTVPVPETEKQTNSAPEAEIQTVSAPETPPAEAQK